MGWIAKKQGPVSHSASEAEVIALEMATRLEGIPALTFWESVVQVFTKTVPMFNGDKKLCPVPTTTTTINQILMEMDYVPKPVTPPSGQAHLIILEDNDAVIKMAIKQRAPQMRHVPRMHRVNLDWLFE